MTIFFSAAEGGFFDDKVHADLPGDAVPISKASHRNLIAAQSGGATIAVNAQGKPFARHAGAGQRRAALIGQAKREARRRIESFAPVWRQINAQRDGTDPGWSRIDAVREASALIEEHIRTLPAARLSEFDVTLHPFWPEFD